MKKELAEAYKQTLNDLKLKSSDVVSQYTVAMYALNFVIEELAESKSEAYKNIPMNDEVIKTIMANIIKKWDSIQRVVDNNTKIQANKILLPFIEKSILKGIPDNEKDKYVLFVNSIILQKAQEFKDRVDRNENAGFGKGYRPFFTSGLRRVTVKVQEILDSVNNNKEKLKKK